MPASGGVGEFEGTGFEFTYFGQLIADSLLTAGDVGVLGLRFTDSKTADMIAGSLSASFPIPHRLRATPRLYTDYRMHRDTEDLVLVRPSLRFDLNVWRLFFDTEVGLDWDLPQGGSASRLDFFFFFGARYDF